MMDDVWFSISFFPFSEWLTSSIEGLRGTLCSTGGKDKMVSVACSDVETMRRWVGGMRKGWSRAVVCERKRKSEMNQDSKLKEELSQVREKKKLGKMGRS